MNFKYLFYLLSAISPQQDRTALLFLLFPLTLLILRSWIWEGCLPAFPVQLYQVLYKLFLWFFIFILEFGSCCWSDAGFFFLFCDLMLSVCYVRHGCCSFTLVWLCERTYCKQMEVIFVRGNCMPSFFQFFPQSKHLYFFFSRINGTLS